MKKLGEITSWSSGGTPPKDNPLFWNGNIPWISASSMRGIVYSDSELKITEAGLKRGSKLAKKGTLLILVRGSMLFNKIPIGIVSKDVAFNQDVKCIVVNSYTTSEYILNWFGAFEPKILNMVTGTGIGAGKLDLLDLKALEIKIPLHLEQKKISSLLSLIQDRIQTQNKIIGELKILKSTLAYKIFSKQLRFKDNDGNDFPDWKIQKMGEITTITTGSSNREDSILDGEFTFFDRSQDIRKSNRYLFDKEAIIVPVEGQEFIPKYFNGKFDLHQRTYAIFDFKNIDGKFLFYHILQNDKHLQSQAVGSTVKSLRLPMFETMPICLPIIKEQTKIAIYLSQIDDKIETEKKLLVQYENQKKYLLQNLFI